MTIVITFVPCFISLLEGCIKPSVKLGTAIRIPKIREQRKNEEIISSNCLPHHKRASSFTNKHEAAQLHLLTMLSRYWRMSESMQHDKQWSSFKEYPNFESREKNEEIISSNCLPHHKRASSFTNKHEAARLHLLTMSSRYRRMSESVQHDEQWSSFHDRWCFPYDEQCPSFHAERLITPSPVYKQTSKSVQYLKYFLASWANNYTLYQNSVTEIVEYEYSVLLIFHAWIVQFVECLFMTVSC